ncbi:hypothetical protein RJ639_020901 [Escallonia herrerae]|uniref:RNase H type-1 domain-containing protein n=1 Tax=Escallonia herrerae TaxID=1293975 RepID=A0AA89AGX6_9ASTE|nr:hypothetical protein RJ639_020901 [Escallonia herrerae]
MRWGIKDRCRMKIMKHVQHIDDPANELLALIKPKSDQSCILYLNEHWFYITLYVLKPLKDDLCVVAPQFNIKYVPQKAIKGHVLTDFLTAHPILKNSPLVLDLLDEEVMQTEIKKGWEMYFDGALRSPDGEKQNDPRNNQSGIGIVFVTPEWGIIPHSFSLTEGCSNNEAEYEAINAGLELSLEVSIDDLTIYGDSELIIKQLKGEYQIRKPNLFPYYERTDCLFSKFPKL